MRASYRVLGFGKKDSGNDDGKSELQHDQADSGRYGYQPTDHGFDLWSKSLQGGAYVRRSQTPRVFERNSYDWPVFDAGGRWRNNWRSILQVWCEGLYASNHCSCKQDRWNNQESQKENRNKDRRKHSAAAQGALQLFITRVNGDADDNSP